MNKKIEMKMWKRLLKIAQLATEANSQGFGFAIKAKFLFLTHDATYEKPAPLSGPVHGP